MESVGNWTPAVEELFRLYEGELQVGTQGLRDMVLFWDRPSLDATVLGYDAFQHLDCITRVRGRESPRIVFNVRIAEYTQALWDFLRECADPSSKTFRHSPDPYAWPTVYANYYAVSLANMLGGSFEFNRHFEDVSKQLDSVIDASCSHRVAQFILGCREERYGGFGEYPGAESNLITSEAATKVLPALGYRDERGDLVKSLQEYIKRCREPSEGFLTYVNNPGTRTENGTCHRYAAYLNEESRFRLSEGDIRRSLGYIRACHNDDGGFGANRGQPSTLFATQHHLSALRKYLRSYGRSDEWASEARNLAGRLRSYLGQWRSRDFAFGFTPDSPSNILALRDALAIVRTLAEDEEVQVNLFEEADLEAVFQALERHFDYERGAFRGYADAYLAHSSQSPAPARSH